MTDDLIDIGVPVRVRGRQGTFVVRGYNKDGSYKLWGGKPQHEMFTDAKPALVKPLPVKRRRREDA